MAGKIDTVTVEVVRNLLMSIAEETYGIIVRSAYSTNMKERRDVCTAVIDPDGNSVAQVESLAALLGSMLSVVPNIYEKFGRENVKPGDMFIANDPYHGGGNHLPDIVIAAPAFCGDKLIGWIANIAHHADIGGKVPGSTSGDADSLFQEGIRIPVIRFRENDKDLVRTAVLVLALEDAPDAAQLVERVPPFHLVPHLFDSATLLLGGISLRSRGSRILRRRSVLRHELLRPGSMC